MYCYSTLLKLHWSNLVVRIRKIHKIRQMAKWTKRWRGTLWTGLLLPVLKAIVKRVLYKAFRTTFSNFSLYSSGHCCLSSSEITLSHLLYVVLFWKSLQNEITVCDKQSLRTLTLCSHSYSMSNQTWIFQFPKRSASHISLEINKPFVWTCAITIWIYCWAHWEDLRWPCPQ